MGPGEECIWITVRTLLDSSIATLYFTRTTCRSRDRNDLSCAALSSPLPSSSPLLLYYLSPLHIHSPYRRLTRHHPAIHPPPLAALLCVNHRPPLLKALVAQGQDADWVRADACTPGHEPLSLTRGGRSVPLRCSGGGGGRYKYDSTTVSSPLLQWQFAARRVLGVCWPVTWGGRWPFHTYHLRTGFWNGRNLLFPPTCS